MLQNEIMCQKFVLTQNPLAKEKEAEFVLYPASPYYILQFAAIRVSVCARLKYFGGISIFPLHPLKGEVCTSFIYAILILFQGSKP